MTPAPEQPKIRVRLTAVLHIMVTREVMLSEDGYRTACAAAEGNHQRLANPYLEERQQCTWLLQRHLAEHDGELPIEARTTLTVARLPDPTPNQEPFPEKSCPAH